MIQYTGVGLFAMERGKKIIFLWTSQTCCKCEVDNRTLNVFFGTSAATKIALNTGIESTSIHKYLNY